jgi:hypothetical protein
MAEWEGGDFLGKEDSASLLEAAKQGLTLVTYDRRTIPPLLKTWAEEEQRHGGVIFVDEKTISPADIGGLVRALIELSKETGKWDWADRVYFLHRGKHRSTVWKWLQASAPCCRQWNQAKEPVRQRP